MILNNVVFNPLEDPDFVKILRGYLRSYQTAPYRVIQTGANPQICRIIADTIDVQHNYRKFSYYVSDASYSKVRELEEEFKDYPWMRIRHAIPWSFKMVERYLNDDPMLRLPERYPEPIRVDAEDPISFYMKEASGTLFGDTKKPDEFFLQRSIPIKKHKVFFILNGIGGLGLMEFHLVRQLMKKNQYRCLFMDLDHVKHCRTLDFLNGNRGDWEIQHIREPYWVFASYKHKRRSFHSPHRLPREIPCPQE